MNEHNIKTVSVVIPTYNRASILKRAIGSVLKQTYRDFEIIVIDDGSVDNTENIVKDFKDDRIRYIKHVVNKGGSSARNTGIKASKGKYIAFLDDDDEWMPKKLEIQIKKIESSSDEVGVIYSGVYIISEANQKTISTAAPIYRDNVYVDLLRECILFFSTALVKRDCFNKTGLFDETLPGSQDRDMWIRLSRYYRFDFVPDLLTKYYIHGRQITADLKVKIKAKELLITKYQNELLKYPAIYAKQLTRLGMMYCLLDNRKSGRQYFLKAIKLKVFYGSSYVHFFLSFIKPSIHKALLVKHPKYGFKNIDNISLYY